MAVLVTTFYFILGSIPLLVLKHDTPLDARFMRGFFNIHYAASLTAARLQISRPGKAGLPPPQWRAGRG